MSAQPEEGVDTGRVARADTPVEADPADIVEQTEEVPDLEDEELVVDDEDEDPANR